MKTSARLAGCLLAAFLAVGGHALAQSLQPVERIAAVVDEDVILQSELDRAVRNIRAQYAGREAQLPPPDVLQRQVLERLVLTRLQVARAAQAGIQVNDQDVDAAIGRIAESNQLTIDQLRQQLASTGQAFDDFRDSIREELLVQRLRQSYAQGRINVSEAEVDAALSAQAGGTQYHLANILVALPDGATPEQIATGQQKIEGIKSLLDRGEMDFAAAAVRYSDSPNALDGGDLGWRGIDEIPPAFVALLRDMQPGQVVGPIRGSSGFQLIRLVETRDAAAQAGAGTITEFNARHILVRVDEDTSESEARARIDQVAARVAGGADFAAQAREHSEDENNRQQGGDLGWFAADAFGTAFGAQVAALADGAVSAPFRSDAGWHIVQRTGSRERAGGDDNQRAQVRDMIGRRKLEEEYNRFLREMRGEAFVEIRTGTAADATAAPGG